MNTSLLNPGRGTVSRRRERELSQRDLACQSI